MPDPGLEKGQAQSSSMQKKSRTVQIPKKTSFEIDTLEVWGITTTPEGGEDDEVTKQKKRLEWEEAEAARRAGVNFGGDKDGARALLEMAGLVGDRSGSVGRSGGSV